MLCLALLILVSLLLTLLIIPSRLRKRKPYRFLWLTLGLLLFGATLVIWRLFPVHLRDALDPVRTLSVLLLLILFSRINTALQSPSTRFDAWVNPIGAWYLSATYVFLASFGFKVPSFAGSAFITLLALSAFLIAGMVLNAILPKRIVKAYRYLAVLVLPSILPFLIVLTSHYYVSPLHTIAVCTIVIVYLQLPELLTSCIIHPLQLLLRAAERLATKSRKSHTRYQFDEMKIRRSFAAIDRIFTPILALPALILSGAIIAAVWSTAYYDLAFFPNNSRFQLLIAYACGVAFFVSSSRERALRFVSWIRFFTLVMLITSMGKLRTFSEAGPSLTLRLLVTIPVVCGIVVNFRNLLRQILTGRPTIYSQQVAQWTAIFRGKRKEISDCIGHDLQANAAILTKSLELDKIFEEFEQKVFEINETKSQQNYSQINNLTDELLRDARKSNAAFLFDKVKEETLDLHSECQRLNREALAAGFRGVPEDEVTTLLKSLEAQTDPTAEIIAGIQDQLRHYRQTTSTQSAALGLVNELRERYTSLSGSYDTLKPDGYLLAGVIELNGLGIQTRLTRCSDLIEKARDPSRLTPSEFAQTLDDIESLVTGLWPEIKRLRSKLQRQFFVWSSDGATVLVPKTLSISTPKHLYVKLNLQRDDEVSISLEGTMLHLANSRKQLRPNPGEITPVDFGIACTQRRGRDHLTVRLLIGATESAHVFTIRVIPELPDLLKLGFQALFFAATPMAVLGYLLKFPDKINIFCALGVGVLSLIATFLFETRK